MIQILESLEHFDEAGILRKNKRTGAGRNQDGKRLDALDQSSAWEDHARFHCFHSGLAGFQLDHARHRFGRDRVDGVRDGIEEGIPDFGELGEFLWAL